MEKPEPEEPEGDLESFVEKTKELLRIEQECEIEQTEELMTSLSPKELVERGIVLDKLEISTQATGLGGKFLVRFESKWKGTNLPSHKFQPGKGGNFLLPISGDIVSIKDEQGKEAVDSGVIFRVSPSWIQIALNQPNTSPDWGRSTYSILQLANNVTYPVTENLGEFDPMFPSLYLDIDEWTVPCRIFPSTQIVL
jgi:DNA polymerase alpha-associated DNA helicase A